MKWRTSKQLPEINQIIICYTTDKMYIAEYIGDVIGGGHEPYPHMLISGNTLATFDAITAYYWIPLKEFKEELEEGK